jgi:subtilase family serine protease
MPIKRGVWQSGVRIWFWLVTLAVMAGSAMASPGQGTTIGPEDQTKQITITVWLNLHNKEALDATVAQIYDKNSPSYLHFLTMAQYKAQFAPAAKDVAAVTAFLAAHNIKVTSVDQNNHFVMAQGSVGDAQQAFNVQINRMMIDGKEHRVNGSAPTVAGTTGALVAAVQGLNDLSYRSHVSAAQNPGTGTAYDGIPVSSSPGANGIFFNADCLRAPEFHTFTTAGTFPTATYFGNRYGSDITSVAPNKPPCGYDAAEMQEAYGMNTLLNKHLDGTGQTIVIVDAFGSNTITNDANIFSTLNGLPLLTNSNFAIVDANGPGTAKCTAAPNGCIAGNWQFETTLDVEWAHAMAPGANIVLVLAPDNTFTNLDIANLFAIENGIGNVISNSFGIPEIVLAQFAPSELTVENSISELAAALGISQQVSTGDSGDSLIVDNVDFGINSVSPGANSDSPFATAVGGTSTFLDSNHNIKLQTGWGLNETRITNPTPNPPVIPPLNLGFLEGSGGGESTVYDKPKYQKHVKGKFRQTPDISMNADPETGVEIVVTPDSVPGHPALVEVFGGTSLSSPMFTAVWSIANQAAGGGPIGQAAPILYQLPDNAISDVNLTNTNALLNVSGVILNPPAPPSFESATALAQPLGNTKLFVSALFQSSSSTRWNILTFGTDSSLTTGPGWDNVTGLGTPNGETFIDAVVAEVTHH